MVDVYKPDLPPDCAITDAWAAVGVEKAPAPSLYTTYIVGVYIVMVGIDATVIASVDAIEIASVRY